MFDIGRICIKIAGRDSGKSCVIVEKLKGSYVLIDGQTRRRKCNTSHLEPTSRTLDISSKADHATIVSAFKKIDVLIVDTKPRKAGKKPVQRRKGAGKKKTIASEVKKETSNVVKKGSE